MALGSAAGMASFNSSSHAGYTVIEIMVVLCITAILATVAWPTSMDFVERAELSSAAQTVVDDIRRIQREARVSGERFGLVVDPASGTYVAVSMTGALRGHRLPTSLAFAAPDNPESDGVTFRDNTVWVAPRPGPQGSVGSISIRSRNGSARKVTVSLTGHTSIAVWDGQQWR
jgi:prepilin-type N-terminal cleavage/methylation domain-containing protein